MEPTTFNAEGYRLQPRINLRRHVEGPPPADMAKPQSAIHHFLFGRDKNCTATPESNTCEKPVGGNMTIPIVLATV